MIARFKNGRPSRPAPDRTGRSPFFRSASRRRGRSPAAPRPSGPCRCRRRWQRAKLFPGEAVALQKGVDDVRRNIPPDGEADEYGVIFVHIRQPLGNGGAGGGVIHFDAAAAVFVHPVEVGVRIGDGRISNSSAPAALARRSAACRVTPLAENMRPVSCSFQFSSKL